MTNREEIDEVVTASSAGNAAARERLIETIYEDLREHAAQRLALEAPDHTLQATALANEAYLRLAGQDRVDWQGKTHFLAVAAIAVRRILIDHARAKRAAKRGSGAASDSAVEDLVHEPVDAAPVIDLHGALTKLAQREPRQARVVELRFFGGLTLEEAAAELGVSRDTVKLDWRAARAWLDRELGSS